MCSRQVTRLLLRSASVTKDSAIAASCDEPLAAGRVGRTPRGGSTQSATPRGLDCGIVCRIWQGRTRIGPSVRQRPPRFSNITESVGCLHVPRQVPGTFVDYAFLFFLFSASGGWVKIKPSHQRSARGRTRLTTVTSISCRSF